MKTLLMFAVAALLAGAAHAQKVAEAQVPAAAKATFKAKFPTVKSVAWEKEGADYEAGFKQNGKTMSAVITPAGALQETETDMKVEQLPAAVRATLARDYKTYQVKEAEVSKGGKSQDVLFTADGKVAPK